MANWKAEDGTLIHYTLHERGPDRPCLLLLHGLLGTSRQWQPYTARLVDDYNLLLVDLRGHGRSENLALGLQLEQLVVDIAALLKSLTLSNLFVAGYDLGAYLALLLHLSQPRSVKALVMHGAKVFWREKSISAMVGQLNPDHLIERAPEYAERLVGLHGAVKWRPLVRQAADLVSQFSRDQVSEEEISRTRCPLLVSVGDRDEVVTLPEAHRLSRIVDNGSLLVVPGGHHTFPGAEQRYLLVAMKAFFEAADRRQTR